MVAYSTALPGVNTAGGMSSCPALHVWNTCLSWVKGAVDVVISTAAVTATRIVLGQLLVSDSVFAYAVRNGLHEDFYMSLVMIREVVLRWSGIMFCRPGSPSLVVFSMHTSKHSTTVLLSMSLLYVHLHATRKYTLNCCRWCVRCLWFVSCRSTMSHVTQLNNLTVAAAATVWYVLLLHDVVYYQPR